MALEAVEVRGRSAASVVQEDASQSVAGRTESFGSDPFVQGGFVQLK